MLLGALAVSHLGAQTPQQGRITGQVTDAGTRQPVAAAQINIVGTTIGVLTNDRGQYTIPGLRPGLYTVRVLRVGYSERRDTATVTAGQTTTLDLQLQAVATTLNPVVTTATGQQRRVEVGNAIGQIDAAKAAENTGVANMGDLLVARTPGVTVFTPTQVGAGTRVRIRGTSSLSLSNNPIYIVDGVRVEGTTGSSSVSVGGTTPARVNDLNPDEIESIEVVRGPSAATLYGTDAANGVIVITTKHGVAGRPQYTYFTEQGFHADQNTYPTAYRGWTTGSTPSNTTQCYLYQVAAGTCAQDSVTSYNLYADPEATPYGVGYRQAHAVQVGGGTETLRYFLHGEWEDETGVLKVPEFDQRYLAAHGLGLRPEEAHPSHMGRVTGRTQFNIQLAPKASLDLSAGYTSSNTRLPTSDDSGVNGVAGNTYGGPGFKYNLSASGDTLFGWRQFTPRDIYQTYTDQGIKRLITSANGRFEPFEWLSFRGTFGLDYINRTDTQLCRFANCPDLGGDSRIGFKIDNRTNFYTYTANGAVTATRRISDALASNTTLGVQYTDEIFDENLASGVGLPPGSTSISAAATQTSGESRTESRTLGGFLEEHLAYNDRLFVTGAVRSDRNSAFGTNFKTTFYPKLAMSWVASDEHFFPRPAWLDQLRLRGAFGASGVQPGATDAEAYYTATRTLGEAGEATGLVFSALGNKNLKPERSTELELGFDATVWDNRVNLEVTHYNKTSKDALISRVLPPSIGTGATVRFENLGEVRNTGWELLLTAQLLRREAFSWDIGFTGSTNNNKLVSLGGVPNIVLSSTQQHREGYPLYGWWARGLVSYQDKNGNGIIEYNADPALSEITVTDTAVFLGYSLPRRELTFTNGFEFLDHHLRLGALIDYKGGFKTYNNTERIRCASRNNCSGLINPNASLFEQARTVAVRLDPSRTVAGFIEDGDFIRFRELNLSFTAPDSWARSFHGQRLSASFAVRNLGILWTKYTGVDPEAFDTTGDAPSEFQAFGPPTYYVLRLTLGF
ncbi:MAG: SusC/RagA family TonB-linked outer membrane protein [Gemmatimonadaceae bacterium]|nr:SusC/RagA family TonB-linked outer membrane protein [Gemmatimonadaceae bacterium]